ncbi:MAG: sigma-70 family RNA polymerase sigma factor [Chlorobi bacterium]|nr:sigma-70 family RNA polymerase sigma factor [Chlorobiota bacterium]
MKDKDLLIKLFSGGRDSEKAWKDFLRQYSKLILKIIWKFTNDYDQVMNEYLLVCTSLCCDNFKLLHKFKLCRTNKQPRFSCWLSTVVRNLCIDEYRKTFGRKYLPKALTKMDSFEKRVFNLYYRLDYGLNEIENMLQAENNGRYSIGQIIADIEDVCADKKRLSFFYRKNAILLVEFDDSKAYKAYQDKFVDERREIKENIENLISSLPPLNQELVQLKYWEGMSGIEIARLLNVNQRKVYHILTNSLRMLKDRVVF